MKNVETPHTYNLRPSQAKQLYDSTLIIWVGAGVETFLIKPFNGQA
jgi:zinc transport system substrate-binding protein